MKFISVSNINLYLLFIFCLLGCKKEKQDELLPPELQQEFNCHINGEYWTMKPGGNCHKLYTLYAKEAGSVGNNPSAYLIVKGKDCQTDNTFYITMDSVISAGTYSLPEDDYNPGFIDWYAAMQDTAETYPIEHYKYYPIRGRVDISELNPQNYREEINPDTGQPVYHKVNGWIEGTFEMTLINDISLDSNNTQHDTLKITDGKFAVIL